MTPEEMAAWASIGVAVARMTRLLEKAKTGDISPQQAEALHNYRHVGRLLELMNSRARRSLQTKRVA